MTTVTAEHRLTSAEIDDRLRVWCERWRYAPDAVSRSHAQTAIDQWLDRRLDLDVLTIPSQDAPAQPVPAAAAALV